MDHAAIRERVFAFYDGELAGDARQEVEAHLQGCPECRAMVERWTATAGVFFKKPQPDTSEFFVQRVMDRIETQQRPRPALRWRVELRWLVPALGLTAMLFVVMQPAQQPVSVEMLLLGDTGGATSWVLSNGAPTADEMLGLAMEGRQ